LRGFLPLVASGVLVLGWTARTGTQDGPHPPIAAARDATPVGAQACAACHQQIHAAWKSGRHSRMIQSATDASVTGDFAQSKVTLHGRPYRLRAANGEYFITESYLTGKEREHRVEFTLGSRRIQHYLTTIENGRIIVLPPSWDVTRHEWFDNMDIVRPDENDSKPFQQWNKNCVGCHVSQQENDYRPATQTYATRWMDFGTSCERCHGPGSAHVQTYSRAGRQNPPGQRSIVRPTRLDPQTSSMVCAQCHSLRDVIAPGYRAGDNYYDYFVPVLEYGARKESDPNYWSDGRPRRFSNDAIGLWQSECFLRGGATCTTCHDGHEPDVDRNAQLAASNNALCTRCHQDVGARLTTHTRHQAGSAGSSCVECHMPRTVVSIKATIRDHSMSLPAPENTIAFGIPNACTECHADKKASWAVDVVREWWPQNRRAKMIARAEGFSAARAGRPEAVERLVAIAADDRQGPLVQANALGYLRHFADPRAAAALTSAVKSGHPAIRSVAVASLGQLPIKDPAARATMLAALDDPQRAVRIAALVSLMNSGGGPFDADDDKRFRRVSAEYVAAARLREDDPTIQTNRGFVHLVNGELVLAADALQIALALEPRAVRPTFLLALVRVGQGRAGDARALLNQLPPSDPNYAIVREKLKQLERRP
jgi:predicted CXXCH cytochrome family protein